MSMFNGKGSYLRTNYRTTGGLLDVLALGGAVQAASTHAGAGTALPYAGFIWTSYIGSFCSAAHALSTGFGDSTLGLMSAFYGSTIVSNIFGSGYRFFPCGMHTLSYSTLAIASMSGGISFAVFYPLHFDSSGSIWWISAQYHSATLSHSWAIERPARLMIWGFICSAPNVA